MRTVIMRLSGFTFLPLLSLVIPLVLLPVMANVVGSAGWGSALAGQAIGTFASAVVLWGWNVEGPILIAKAVHREERAAVYARSVQMRLLQLVLVSPIALLVAWLVAVPGHAAAAMSMALATTLIGMSPSFYGIGAGQPTLLAWYDTFPRSLAVLVTVPFLMLTQNMWTYPAAQGLTMLVSLVLFHRRYAARHRWLPDLSGETLRQIWAQRRLAGYQLAGQAYAATPTPIANATLPAQTGPLATTDQLYRYGLFTVAAMGNAFQAWTLEPTAPNPRRRHLAAVWAHLGLGVIGLLVLVVAGPPVGSLISSGRAPATTELCLLYGLAFVFISVATPFTRNLLVPAGRDRLVLNATIVSAIVGVTTMLVAGRLGSPAGIAAGMAASELLVLLILAPPALRLLNRAAPRSGVTPERADEAP